VDPLFGRQACLIHQWAVWGAHYPVFHSEWPDLDGSEQVLELLGAHDNLLPSYTRWNLFICDNQYTAV
jgi:hypothetical protein